MLKLPNTLATTSGLDTDGASITSGWDAKALAIEPYLLPFTAIAVKGDAGTAASAKRYGKI